MQQFKAAISDFTICRPQYSSSQKDILDWIVTAHTYSESKLNEKSQEDLEKFRHEIQERLWHVGCKPNTIFERGHVIPDFMSHNWNSNQVYRLEESPKGVGLQKRLVIHHNIVDQLFDKLYSMNDQSPPEDIIHVSCTGYASPSGPQKIVSKKNWTGRTNSTHLYHMGCYGSLPAIRIGDGYAQQGHDRVDIVHTELCTLHMNPSIHNSSQLVSQSLFADGCIKYSIVPQKKMKSGKPYLKIVSMHEQIIPNSTQAMEWLIGDWGFHFILAKEIPVLIARALNGYLNDLCRKVGLDVNRFIKNAIFAIHPGGPKILDYVQKGFEIEDWQIQASRTILKKYGNMSSATLPHIWDMVCSDSQVPCGTQILCMAFGPGLTIAGAILQKDG